MIVATPLNNETRGLFNDATFAKMKKNAIFVNVGRGAVVDTNALVRALRNKTIFAAGLDVIDPEPLPSDHEILKLPNAGCKIISDISQKYRKKLINCFLTYLIHIKF